jgi:hypothetical protein
MAARPMEKVYVHTDKPDYMAGDTLYLKAYLVDAMVHAPDSISGVLYVDITKPGTRQLITHRLLRATDGFASGAISLSDTLAEGNYDLRAYTSWMLNSPDTFFFHKPFHLYKTIPAGKKTSDEALQKASVVADVQFFPEGGQLVNGIENRVGFKGVNAQGYGIDFTGYVISDKGDTIVRMKPQHLGLGLFTFTPAKGRSYSFRTGSGTSAKEFPLPVARDEGYNMMVDNLNKNFIRVFVKYVLPKPDRAILIAHQRGKVFYAAQVSSDKTAYAFSIAKETVPADGVVHLTLFNSAGVPQCERVVYVDKNKPLKVDVLADKETYHPRERVTCEFTVTDDEGVPVEGNFSLTVTDENQVMREPFAGNIESYLMLTSDVENLHREIRGVIEAPAYYFDRSNNSALVHLDLLLMTQGWRRFRWNDVLTGNVPSSKHLFERGIAIGGQVLLPNGKPSKKPIELTIMIRGGFFQETADENGHFTLYDLDFTDSTSILVQGKKSGGGKNVDVLFDKPFVPEVTPAFSDENHVPFDRKKFEEWMQRQRAYEEATSSLRLDKVQTLKTVEVTAQREEPEDDPRRIMYSGNVRTFKIDRTLCGGAMNVLQMIQGRVAGAQVQGSGLNWTILLRGKTPGLLVDGMPMADMTILNSISPCDVEAIDISTTPSVLIPNGSGGMISILTRRGNTNYDWSQEKAMGIAINKFMGFDAPREFYTPRYEPDATSKAPDVRSTLSWQPEIRTDADGKAVVEFWTSDEKTTLRLSLEGISLSGKPVAASFEYKVK